MLCRSVMVCGCSCLVLGSVVSSREKKKKGVKSGYCVLPTLLLGERGHTPPPHLETGEMEIELARAQLWFGSP